MLRTHRMFVLELSIGQPNVILDKSKSKRKEIMKYIEKGIGKLEA